MRLTDRKIKSIVATGKEQSFSDGNCLVLRVRANGTKSWRFKYTVNKKVTKLSLGAYPAVTLAEARSVAVSYMQLLAKGIDPKEYESTKKLEASRKLANTFLAAAELWFERKQPTVTPHHAAREWRTLEMYIFPKLKDSPLESITAINTIEILRPLETDGKHSTIKRICQSLNQIMDYSVNHGFINANPLAKIIKVFTKNTVEHMATIRPEELPNFLTALNSSQTIQNKTRLLILWQLHTMTRSKEAAGTKWEDINIEEAVWIIPAEEMKRRRAHRVPLTSATLAILEQMKPLSGHHEYVFPSERNEKSHASTYTVNAAIKRSLGYKNKLVAHGLRSVASTALYEKGYDSLLVEACLAHADENETRAAYNRSDYLEQRRPIMLWWSEFIGNNNIDFPKHLTQSSFT
ncbi:MULTISPECIES: tyrosine-type recombinase/integrase [unclassified Pseudoalteromonas]|uniref:tyrosine-type recombinase/integrase n=1 Tax=unclassified Pseudoalteromonas TaxID=194690 RepID=UPI0015FF3E1E|nr:MULTISPECIES: tyrosine-type recombinase/integrase [unclassified Pseudoalteromonas]MBB1351242.1 tyrosine-type recombinase/integrase [Pseudoalteromonas sp. SG45-3]MBB1358656.1 tyrosine-type recombinase/integrase [Pseudoalteromonas sp. SG45-6]